MPGSKDPIELTNEILLDGTFVTNVIRALPATTRKIRSVLVQADPNNGADIFVGNATSQSVQLIPGGVWRADIDNPVKIYVRPAAGTQRVNWQAVGGV